MLNRRSFLKKSAVVTAGAMLLPAFLKAYQNDWKGKTEFKGRRLIILQLTGGNDGLNTLVPFEDDIYYQKRPRLAIPKQELIKLDELQGWNPAMQPLQALWEEGECLILNAVGYPDPDRSHFRSMDIWQTGSAANEFWSKGWLGRYLEQLPQPKPYTALELDNQLSLALKGEKMAALAVNNPKQFKRQLKSPIIQALLEQQHAAEHEQLAYLYQTLGETESSANYLMEKAQLYTSSGDYPKTGFGKDLKQIAELISAGCETQIYYASLTGFDTHANQKNKQAQLLGQYAQAVAALRQELRKAGEWENTLIMTFSEFGRRLAENGSGGSDHGTANNLYLMGGGLKKAGIYNAPASLSQLDQGDLIYDIDFRRVYQAILSDWLQADAKAVLGRSLPKLDIF
ncbi:DUF1501 domain-containing protein [Saprospira grandis]|uniref:Twin-arginine translocation pathway signal n=1 Tax=Saprospira grandis (strain Lewin) TaxID=984262 RepID=H6L1S1_SAPGL|nr:DUF1501 domain-containing protein [Saprospira grandis]AFC26149.1 hypothetical protein SGRA_3424 [Saprospira grandis str. Lewin]